MFNKKINFEINLLLRYFFLLLIYILLQNTIFLNYLKLIIVKITYFILYPFYINYINYNLNSIQINNFNFKIVDACIANNAYIIIAILFLTININYLKSIKYFLEGFLIFTIFNILRIIVLIIIQIHFGNYYFENIHLLFYEFLSGIFVFLIIYYIYRKNNLLKKHIPLFDDIKKIIKQI